MTRALIRPGSGSGQRLDPWLRFPASSTPCEQYPGEQYYGSGSSGSSLAVGFGRFRVRECRSGRPGLRELGPSGAGYGGSGPGSSGYGSSGQSGSVTRAGSGQGRLRVRGAPAEGRLRLRSWAARASGGGAPRGPCRGQAARRARPGQAMPTAPVWQATPGQNQPGCVGPRGLRAGPARQGFPGQGAPVRGRSGAGAGSGLARCRRGAADGCCGRGVAGRLDSRGFLSALFDFSFTSFVTTRSSRSSTVTDPGAGLAGRAVLHDQSRSG